MFDALRRALGREKAQGAEEDGSEGPFPPGTGIPAGVLVLGNTSFSQTIRKYPLTVVDFWAPWCAPCRMVSPVIEQLSRDYAGIVAFGKVNVDKEKWVAASYRVRSIPTIMIFSRGRSVERVVGAVPRRVLESKLRSRLDGGFSSRSR